jgi:hypothetical protein
MNTFGVSTTSLVVALTIVAPPAAAQTAFFSRSAFHLSAEHLSSEDDRFVWDAEFGGEIDLVDYGAGRVTLLANYEAILGEEFRAFDPNQGNYTLGAVASARVGPVELSALFHHVSRHLSDRFKREPVDWNMIGARIVGEARNGRMTISSRGDVRGVLRKSTVDYRWEVDGGLAAHYAVAPRVAVHSRVGLRLVGVDGSQARGTQTGFRVEGGAGFSGEAGALEVFVAFERRIDPHPLEFGTATWPTVGFRLLSR